MKIILLSTLTSVFLTCIAFILGIPLLKRIKAGQPIYEYVKTHKSKDGTPTMGGLFFVLCSSIVFLIFYGVTDTISIFSLSITLAFMVVGFLDDFLKIRYKQNQGLKAYQKILFQSSISLICGFFAYNRGVTIFNIPFFPTSIEMGVWTIPVVALVFIAVTNSVNLTDGLDGLAGSSSIIYLIFICILIYCQNSYSVLLSGTLIPLSCVFIGGLLAFLVFNVSKAQVFMGDTGSLAIGGLISSVSIFSSNSFIIPVLGIVFVLSSVSVILQVAVYKKTKKRVFLMAPFHHHLQMKGLSESKISYLYSLVTVIMGVLLVISYV